MKNYILFLLIIESTGLAFSQGQRGDATGERKGREKIKAAHAAYITERLELTSGEAEKFWPVYREYGQKRKTIRQQYREAKRNGDGGQALVDLHLKIKQQELDLEKAYSVRFLEIIPAEKMVRLQQAENDFRKLVLRQIQQRRRH
jgi:hypothetical protein